MKLPRVRFTVRRLMALIAMAAVLVTALRSPPSEAKSRQEAIRIAAAHAMSTDPTFRPERYTAKAYVECSLSPWTVDFTPVGGADVVRRIRVSFRGFVQGYWAFGENEHVKSYRESQRSFLLGSDGAAVAEVLAPFPDAPQ
jgi:hypothetical protein